MRSLEHRQRQASVDAAGRAPLRLGTGWPEIDRLLVGDTAGVDGGLMVGAVHECLGLCTGAPDSRRDWMPPLSILLHLAWRSQIAGQQRGKVVWIGRQVWPMPVTLAQGWNLRAGLIDHSLFVDAVRPSDRLWAIDVALRTAGVRMVIADGSGLDMAASRRLQLAAEAGTQRGVICILARPAHEESMLTCATTRWRISPAPVTINPGAADRFGCVRVVPRWNLELLRCKGMQPALHSQWRWVVEADHGKGLVCVPADVDRRSGPPASSSSVAPLPIHRFTRRLRQAS